MKPKGRDEMSLALLKLPQVWTYALVICSSFVGVPYLSHCEEQHGLFCLLREMAGNQGDGNGGFHYHVSRSCESTHAENITR